MNIFEISTSAVAWYAAIVATIGAIIAVLNFFRDRARVVIEYQKDRIILGQQSVYEKDKPHFAITVINRGRRPINIAKAYLRIIGGRKKTFHILTDSFAQHRKRVLNEESPSTDFLVPQDEISLENL